jgi:HTH-type transcriptional regulator/antitoxin HigA
VASERSLPRGDQDLLDLLSDLVSAYEDRHDLRVDTASVTPIEMVRYFMEQRGTTGSDLGRALGNRQSGYDVLSGRRGLTKAHIRKLAEFFHCSPAVFL